MKPSKRQPPLPRQRMQGVIIESDRDRIILSPCPQRADNMCKQIMKHIEEDCLTSDHARRLAGKCIFLTGRFFGKVGRAPLKAIYARTHCSHSSIDKPTWVALWSLLDIIRHCRPMRIFRRPYTACFSVIYTDAYLKLGQSRLRPGDNELPETLPDVRHLENGLGAIASLTKTLTRQRTSRGVCRRRSCCSLATLNLSSISSKLGCR